MGAGEHVFPAVRARLEGGYVLVEQLVDAGLGHGFTSGASACRGTRRAVESVAPTVPGLTPSASAIVA